MYSLILEVLLHTPYLRMLPQVYIPIIQFCLAYKKGLWNYHILVQNFQQEAYNTWRKKKRIFKEDYINL